jgi:DNA-binding transcriptional LysR family regulator
MRVAAPVSFGTRHLPPALFAFAAAHPAVRLDLVLSDRRIDLVSENVDLALRIGRLSEADLIARRLARIRHVACASPAYLAARGTPATPAELAEHDGLCYGGVAKPATWSCKHPDGRIERLQPRERLRADNGDVLRQAALDGLGIIVEPTFIVHADLEAGRLVPILTAVSWSKVHLHAVYAPTRHLSRKVRALIDSLADRFAGTPPWDRDMPLPAHDP